MTDVSQSEHCYSARKHTTEGHAFPAEVGEGPEKALDEYRSGKGFMLSDICPELMFAVKGSQRP